MNEIHKHQKLVEGMNGDSDGIKQYWTEHRITLIAFETQYVYQKKPVDRSEREKESNQNNHKSKKRNLEFEGAFLFPGLNQKQREMNVVEQIHKSKCRHLKQLFEGDHKNNEDAIVLRQFVRIMLQLKHFSVFQEFMAIYELVIQEIKDIKFQNIRAEQERMMTIDKIVDKLVRTIQEQTEIFKKLNSYLKENPKETAKLLKVTVYCFLAEKHNFNINQYYAQAFDIMEEEKAPRKKRKTQ